MSAHWLRTTGRDGNTHALFFPELKRHILSTACACRPQIRSGVIVHAVLTAAYVPPQRREREH